MKISISTAVISSFLSGYLSVAKEADRVTGENKSKDLKASILEAMSNKKQVVNGPLTLTPHDEGLDIEFDDEYLVGFNELYFKDLTDIVSPLFNLIMNLKRANENLQNYEQSYKEKHPERYNSGE